jgi:hypothetical protein
MIRYLSVVVLALLSAPAFATVFVFQAPLSGASESPPTGSLGTGSATVTMNDTAHTMRVQVTFAGLSGNTTMAHIHCCQTSPGTPPNVGVATELPSFTGFPLGVTSGTYDHTFDTSVATTFNPAFVTSHGGTAAGAESALIAGMTGDLAYLNIHSTVNGGGEIRGFPVPVPEAETYALLGLGLGMLAVMLGGRKKRH